ncbi:MULTISPECIES: FRG domain-containing protein [unclassified Paenibacillus]|uniref:FRG domain-containing protein n=1 Tax=unclassified Paenibacillus TaxID=185978 RepID=UPI0004151579|nr:MULTISPECIES: FRG domain-containing protein [unclassified Paenibacillus]KGP80073.1 hypothetical protein P364_0121970 [Paenibacillus sp. MAEPY2]KGP89426.1 hypothetical protein P363_0100320 [Paenibacillus sp. MAEPY1]
MITYDQVVKIVHINSAREMFDILSPFDNQYELLNNGFIFRGESTTKYTLVPTALRPGKRKELHTLSKTAVEYDTENDIEYFQRIYEYRILQDFFMRSDNNGLKIPHVEQLRDSMGLFFKEMHIIHKNWLPKEFHELAAIAQHYGLPTRLLDWSLDPFVSLYFASVNALKQGIDENDHMVLWVLDRKEIELNNVSKNPTSLEIISPPYGGNDNLRAQKGILTYWKSESLVMSDGKINFTVKTDRDSLDQLIYKNVTENVSFQKKPKILLYKFLIPNDEAKNLFLALQKLNYDAAKLFPGFDGISKSITELILILED